MHAENQTDRGLPDTNKAPLTFMHQLPDATWRDAYNHPHQKVAKYKRRRTHCNHSKVKNRACFMMEQLNHIRMISTIWNFVAVVIAICAIAISFRSLGRMSIWLLIYWLRGIWELGLSWVLASDGLYVGSLRVSFVGVVDVFCNICLAVFVLLIARSRHPSSAAL